MHACMHTYIHTYIKPRGLGPWTISLVRFGSSALILLFLWGLVKLWFRAKEGVLAATLSHQNKAVSGFVELNECEEGFGGTRHNDAVRDCEQDVYANTKEKAVSGRLSRTPAWIRVPRS